MKFWIVYKNGKVEMRDYTNGDGSNAWIGLYYMLGDETIAVLTSPPDSNFHKFLEAQK